MQPPTATNSPPERIGRYQVLLPIASGGMATVYLARAQGAGGFERDVALKLTHAHIAQQPEMAADLLEEAKLTVQIRHANVVAVLDAGEDPQGVFLVMEYIEGDTLAGLLRAAASTGASLPPGVALRILHDALTGLHAAHEATGPDGRALGLVHRDFSPQNILVGLDGQGRLTDFGVARALSRTSHTTTGIVKGKLAYMAPEQARGLALDRRCDVWAAGVIAWEALTMRRLYPNDNDASTLLRIVTETPPSVRALRPELPEALAAVVASALTPEVDQRCPTAAALARALSTACRASGLPLAEPAEVAEVVARVAGARLHERRRQVAAVAELRQRVGRITERAQVAATPISQSSPAGAAPLSAAAPPGPAPRPDLAPAPYPPSPGWGASPTLPSAPGWTGTQALPSTPSWPGAPPAAAGWPAPGVGVHSPVAGGPVPEPSTRTDTTSVAAPQGPPRPRSRALVAAVAGALALAAAGAVILRSRGAPPGAPPAPAGSAPAPTASSSVTEAPSAAPVAAPSASAAATATPAPTVLEITANAPMSSIRVGDRSLPVHPPARTARVERRPAERDVPLDLEVKSADGRRATTRVEADRADVEITFESPRPPPTALPVLPKSPYKR